MHEQTRLLREMLYAIHATTKRPPTQMACRFETPIGGRQAADAMASQSSQP